MAKVSSADSSSYNKIGAGTVITGDIKTQGDIRIDGTITGTLESSGKVVVGEAGVIEGEIKCQNADVEGTIKARIEVAELLSLKATAKLLGEIVTKKLAIEPGAIFSGNCSMGGVVKDMTKHGENTIKAKQFAEAEATA